jgi:hypothetical protein
MGPDGDQQRIDMAAPVDIGDEGKRRPGGTATGRA